MANDFHRVEFGSPRPSRPSAEARSTPPAAAPPASGAAPDQPPRPADGVLVPLDQWNRILGQLGNIHEAGQQLADARERMFSLSDALPWDVVLETTRAGHAAVVAAIEARDRDAARAAMEAHIAIAQRELDQVLDAG